jgi:hypothetical protein
MYATVWTIGRGLRGGVAREAKLCRRKSLYQYIDLPIYDDRVSKVAERLAFKGSFTVRKRVIEGWRALSPHWVKTIDTALGDLAGEYGYR